jgi:hypothetical protein
MIFVHQEPWWKEPPSTKNLFGRQKGKRVFVHQEIWWFEKLEQFFMNRAFFRNIHEKLK